MAHCCISPVKQIAFGGIIFIKVPEHFQHAIIYCGKNIMVVGKKAFTQCKHGRVKLPVQFFLTLGVIIFAAIYNILIQMIQGL